MLNIASEVFVSALTSLSAYSNQHVKVLSSAEWNLKKNNFEGKK